MQPAFIMRAAVTNSVTYTLSGGRLGDNLLAYLHAKWFQYMARSNGINMVMYNKPFPYSDQLALHDKEARYDSRAKYGNIIELKRHEYLAFNQPNTLYVIPYFPESLEELRIPDYGPHAHNAVPRGKYPYFSVDWDDQAFLQEVRQLVKPKNNLNLVYPPKDYVSVAIHVRKNSNGFDLPMLHGLSDAEYKPSQKYVDVIFPLKHPSDEYYIEQIKRLVHMFEGQQLYIYIFTDHLDPAVIVNKYAQEINCANIVWDYRRDTNRHDLNVLEDLFSMMNFDCLIRPDANLSIVASKLGDYKVVITPAHHHWEGRRLIIDKVHISIKK